MSGPRPPLGAMSIRTLSFFGSARGAVAPADPDDLPATLRGRVAEDGGDGAGPGRVGFGELELRAGFLDVMPKLRTRRAEARAAVAQQSLLGRLVRCRGRRRVIELFELPGRGPISVLGRLSQPLPGGRFVLLQTIPLQVTQTKLVLGRFGTFFSSFLLKLNRSAQGVFFRRPRFFWVGRSGLNDAHLAGWTRRRGRGRSGRRRCGSRGGRVGRRIGLAQLRRDPPG